MFDKVLYGVQALTPIGLGDPGRRVRAIGLKVDSLLSQNHENTLFCHFERSEESNNLNMLQVEDSSTDGEKKGLEEQ